MKNQNQSKWFVFGLLLALSLLLGACGKLSIDLNREGMIAKVQMNEKQINDLLHDNKDKSHTEDEFLSEITAIDIQDGLLRVIGKAKNDEGKLVEASYDLKLSAVEGQLKAEIVALDVPGVSLEDARVKKLNAQLAKELSEAATADHNQVRFKEVTLKEDQLRLVMRVNWKETEQKASE